MPEYAIQGTLPSGARYWSDAIPTIAMAHEEFRHVTQANPSMRVDILRLLPRPAGHEFGARWETIRSNY